MKVTCDREKLWHVFQTVASVAPTRSPKPILQNVKLEIGEEGAVLMGTDLDVGIRMGVPGFEVQAPGSVVLPISRFGSILRESSDETITRRFLAAHLPRDVVANLASLLDRVK